MADNVFLLRQVLVITSAILYWGSVIINMYHVKYHIGRFPNIKAKGLREKMLWLGWFLVIVGWIGQPFIIDTHEDGGLFTPFSFFLHPIGTVSAVVMLIGGHLGTIWCYAVLGDSWRIGIDKRERTILIKHGPYRFVRHPIYLFQIIILISVLVLLPTFFSLILLFILIICVILKTGEEESYLMSIYGEEYRAYSLDTGRFLPKWKRL